MVDDFEFKNRYTCKDLVDIVAILRAPGGCPWDREQTHESIRKNFIEETYEAIEGIDKGDPDILREELGDVLLQIMLHCEMEREKGVFDFDDVCNDICKKLIVRHPHVFGEVKVSSSDEVLTNWDAIKRATKKQKTSTESILSIPREFPALMRAQKTQSKAAKAGFDWDDISGALEKTGEETEEVKAALKTGDPAAITDELGDLLFAVVNVCRFAHTDAEEALTFSTDKFTERFAIVERLAAENGKSIKDYSLEELDVFWEQAKKMLKN
ncbi:MAG: nucleoside triphosphate pyrophosphohydrolase [Clostridia bacterium]|nr:nucleoside triphosphate pyrophosphohydrolase [Clostridia bacterium]